EGGQAPARLAFDAWTHVKIDINGVTARVFLDNDTSSTLDIPRLAGVAGEGVGVWTGFFGRGAYYSSIRYTLRAPATLAAKPTQPHGTIVDWELSPDFDASTQTPQVLPALAKLQWEKVHVEDGGYVLINRYRRAPNSGIPVDRATGR